MPAWLSVPQNSHASPLARLALGFYLFVILYASLYPFSGWHNLGVSPWAYLNAPWPRYLTRFDVATNLIAYAPLGALTVLALHPRVRGVLAVIVASLACAGLSASMEALQTFLPNRVASNLDLVLNASGAWVGALACAPIAPALLDRGRLRDLRRRWFAPDASQGLMLAAAWYPAQLFPQSMLFGTGEVVSVMHDILERWIGEPLQWELLGQVTPENLVVFETLCSASALAGTALLFLQLMRPVAPRLLLLVGFVFGAGAIRCFAMAVAFGIDDAMAWATPGARLGLITGFVLALACSYTPPAVRRSFAVALLTTAAVVVNVVPENPYFAATLAGWHQGQWINFNGLLHMLAMAWPYLAVMHLLRRPVP